MSLKAYYHAVIEVQLVELLSHCDGDRGLILPSGAVSVEFAWFSVEPAT